ncbi:Putative protein [Zobellia galactanivorans]|uniref:Uncharacterized protein n=1 Tax=Zobellia galactanivorans (strain DSM 12802 / CCUG 47099 / CIP 106680 / NCIMB 13871 / Dsij) TaxID=63186 RepID=G0L1V2_ZOBGA|nr:Putative protein [Zobellia galactanivorans]
MNVFLFTSSHMGRRQPYFIFYNSFHRKLVFSSLSFGGCRHFQIHGGQTYKYNLNIAKQYFLDYQKQN